MMKSRVKEGNAYQNSPFRGNGRPGSNVNNRSNANSAMKTGAPYGDQPSMVTDGYSDDDFNVAPTNSSKVAENYDEDEEMERMRNAMK